MDDRYVTGRGMMGGPKGTYGRYNVGPDVSNLSEIQFNTASDIEEAQRRRLRRKKESGYIGTGSWFWGYPYMVGAMGAGTLISPQDNDKDADDMKDQSQQATGDTGTAPVTSGMAEGGTVSSTAMGTAGGGMP